VTEYFGTKKKTTVISLFLNILTVKLLKVIKREEQNR